MGFWRFVIGESEKAAFKGGGEGTGGGGLRF